MLVRLAVLALCFAACSAPRAPGGTGGGGGSSAAGGGAGGSAGSGGGTNAAGGGIADAGVDAGCPLQCGTSCCQYGELCGLDGGTSCGSDYDIDRRPYCEPCNGFGLCGTGKNFCVGTGPTFCGVDCSSGQACPAGYLCKDVTVVYTRWACSNSNPMCPSAPSMPCTSDSQCMGKCVGGFCAGECSVRPGEQNGFCTCLTDADCPQNACVLGECSLTGDICLENCPAIRCVGVATDAGSRGHCQLGRNCVPAPGLTCVDVRLAVRVPPPFTLTRAERAVERSPMPPREPLRRRPAAHQRSTMPASA